jgi:YqaJ-like viral recombinase domain
MIEQARFLAQSFSPEWYTLREAGVTATAAAKAATPAGMRELMHEAEHGREEQPDNAFMKFGRDYETQIVADLSSFGIAHNDWLISADTGAGAWKMATPDGLNVSHDVIAEVKTTGKDWGDWAHVPIQYRRQVQWQLHVTGAESCVFAWLLRRQLDSGELVAAWLDPKIVIVHPDPDMIEDLVQTAQILQQHKINLDEWSN